MVKRLLQPGSHGMSEWLLQRLTAVLMLLYALVFGLVLLLVRPDGHEGWRELFAVQPFTIATFAFVLSLLLHAWLGLRGVLADYVRPGRARQVLDFAAALAVVAMGAWAACILWGSTA